MNEMSANLIGHVSWTRAERNSWLTGRVGMLIRAGRLLPSCMRCYRNLSTAVGLNGAGRVIRRRDPRREPFGRWLAQRLTGTVAVMEACSGAHNWPRRCIE